MSNLQSQIQSLMDYAERCKQINTAIVGNNTQKITGIQTTLKRLRENLMICIQKCQQHTGEMVGLNLQAMHQQQVSEQSIDSLKRRLEAAQNTGKQEMKNLEANLDKVTQQSKDLAVDKADQVCINKEQLEKIQQQQKDLQANRQQIQELTRQINVIQQQQSSSQSQIDENLQARLSQMVNSLGDIADLETKGNSLGQVIDGLDQEIVQLGILSGKCNEQGCPTEEPEKYRQGEGSSMASSRTSSGSEGPAGGGNKQKRKGNHKHKSHKRNNHKNKRSHKHRK
jgi:chromosome segregation ATPase